MKTFVEARLINRLNTFVRQWADVDYYKLNLTNAERADISTMLSNLSFFAWKVMKEINKKKNETVGHCAKGMCSIETCHCVCDPCWKAKGHPETYKSGQPFPPATDTIPSTPINVPTPNVECRCEGKRTLFYSRSMNGKTGTTKWYCQKCRLRVPAARAEDDLSYG